MGSEIFDYIERIKVLVKFFLKTCGFLRQRLKSSSAELEILFSLLHSKKTKNSAPFNRDPTPAPAP